jgi:hypothetical protein
MQVAQKAGHTYAYKRLPAWCDRVLYHTNMPRAWQPTCLEYKSVDRVATSDHKPVRAVYEVPSVVSPPQVVTDQLDSEPLPLGATL